MTDRPARAGRRKRRVERGSGLYILWARMTTAFVFTGQGAQFAGMGKDLCAWSKIAEQTLAEADRVLQAPITRLCFEGPDQDLALTENTQPCTLAVSIAAYRALGRQPDLAAGHSLGEYSALCAAGALTFADALQLVRERARRMQQAVPVGTGAMVALLGKTTAEAQELCATIRCGVCELANLNCPGQIVLAGEVAAMQEIVQLVGERRARRLPVSVPFHCSMLQDAAAGFATVLEATPMRDPAFPIWCNVDARPVRTAKAAKAALARQFAGAVLWQTSIERMIQEAGCRRFVELGPKPILLPMITKIAQGLGVSDVVTAPGTTAQELAALAG